MDNGELVVDKWVAVMDGQQMMFNQWFANPECIGEMSEWSIQVNENQR